MSDDLSAAAIEAAVPGPLGRPVRFFRVIGSTNDEALRWAEAGAPEGAVVVADHQTQGRGRWARVWEDRPGSSLMFSLVLRPPDDGEVVSLLTTAAGLACAEGVESATGVGACLKWPNDVTVEGRKLAGLLVESVTRGGKVEVAVVGCGLNMELPAGMPDDVARGATSVSTALRRAGDGPRVERIGLLVAILGALERNYSGLTAPAGRADLLQRAERRSEVLGRVVTARTAGGGGVTGIARRLLPTGALEIEAGDATLALHSAEITQLRTAPGPPSS